MPEAVVPDKGRKSGGDQVKAGIGRRRRSGRERSVDTGSKTEVESISFDRRIR